MKNFDELLNRFYDNNVELGLFTTINEEGQNVIVEITPEYLKTSTTQKNGWIRINIYYKDRTVEELYEK